MEEILLQVEDNSILNLLQIAVYLDYIYYQIIGNGDINDLESFKIFLLFKYFFYKNTSLKKNLLLLVFRILYVVFNFIHKYFEIQKTYFR